MELTKKALEERMKVLETQRAQMIANVNACEGGIITIRGLMSDLDREENEETEGREQPAPPTEE